MSTHVDHASLTKVKKNTLDNVKAKPTRISENAAKKTKPASIKLDPSKMTDEQLADLEERRREGRKNYINEREE